MGGIIFDYYNESNCGLVSYILTNVEYRSRGIGSFLINEGLEKLRDEIFNDNNRSVLTAVFFETESPHSHIYEINVKDKEQDKQAYRKDLPTIYNRLRFFKEKAEAKYIDIPYVQPALYKDSNRVHSLYLMILPKFNQGSYGALLSTDIVMSFLREYYSKSPEKDEDISNEKHQELIKKDDDLFRIELFLKIADLHENLDPMGLLNTEDSRLLAKWQNDIRESFLSETARNNRENLNKIAEQLDKKIQRIKKDKIARKSADIRKDKIAKNIADENKNESIARKSAEEIEKEIKEEIEKETKSIKVLDKIFFLKEVPTYIEPKIAFKKCGIAIHILEEKEKKNVPYCPFFHSWEKDLFSQRYEGRKLRIGETVDETLRGRSPYQSKCGTAGKVEITFKSMVEFTSEGRREQLITKEHFLTKEKSPIPTNEKSPDKFDSNPYKKTARYFLNYTYFWESKTIVWEIVFSPEINSHFNEFEIIQISKYFAGTQEKYSPSLQFKIHQNENENEDEEKKKAVEIFKFLSGDERNNKHLQIQAGTIQIDAAFCELLVGKNIDGKIEKEIDKVFKAEIDEYFINETKAKKFNKKGFWEYVFKNMQVFHLDIDNKSKIEFEHLYENIKVLQNMMDTFSGISIGIFDYERIEFEEVVDTIVARGGATGTWIEVMNRGILVCFCLDDYIFSNVNDSIGINPYLIIPNSVISHNINIANLAQDKIREENEKKKNSETLNDIIRLKLKTLIKTESKELSAITHKTNVKENSKDNKVGKTNRIKSLFFEDELNNLQNRKDDAIDYVERKLNLELIPNVFQYTSEQDIYEFGMQHRGVNSLIAQIEKQKSLIEAQKESISSKKSDLFQLKIIFITLVLTFLQIAEVIGFEKGKPLLFVVTFVLILIFIALFLLKKDENIVIIKSMDD